MAKIQCKVKLQGFLGLLLLGILLASCASFQVTQDLSQGAKKSTKWELVAVQAEFVGKSDFLAVTKIDDVVLEKPLIFGLDIILLSPGEHTLTLQLGKYDTYQQLAAIDNSFSAWLAELGRIRLRQPEFAKGRNYLVASYDKIYTSNSRSSKFMQRWVVNYPRTIDADKKWNIESLEPETTDLPDGGTDPKLK